MAEKTLDQYKFEQEYKTWPKWKKFFHGYIFAIKMSGFKALYKYPMNIYRLNKMYRDKK